jgi:hypothetical protein
MSWLIIPVPLFGQINLKWSRDSLFSERNGFVPTFSIFGVRVTWRSKR